MAGRRSELAFFGNHAVEYQEGLDSLPDAIYDLEEMSWRDLETREVVHYEDCLSWDRRQRESLRKSLAGTDDSVRKRSIEQSLDPRFRVEPVEGGLLFSIEGLPDRVLSTQTFQEGQQVKLFSFDKLNAYRKAMENHGLLPSFQLAIDRELAARSMVPNEMEVTLKTPGGEVKIST